MRQFLILFFLVGYSNLQAQAIDPDIIRIQKRTDTIIKFSAEVKIDVDISFINIPAKSARIEYAKNEDTKVFSEDFVLIPKKGLDVSLYQLFKDPFITVDRGTEIRDLKEYRLVNIIPTNRKADFSIATVIIDSDNSRIIEYEINTKKDGSYIVKMNYDKATSILPSKIEVVFEIERIRIPLKYMGKDVQVNKEKYKSNDPKTGTIFLSFNYTDLVYKSFSK